MHFSSNMDILTLKIPFTMYLYAHVWKFKLASFHITTVKRERGTTPIRDINCPSVVVLVTKFARNEQVRMAKVK